MRDAIPYFSHAPCNWKELSSLWTSLESNNAQLTSYKIASHLWEKEKPRKSRKPSDQSVLSQNSNNREFAAQPDFRPWQLNQTLQKYSPLGSGYLWWILHYFANLSLPSFPARIQSNFILVKSSVSTSGKVLTTTWRIPIRWRWTLASSVPNFAFRSAMNTWKLERRKNECSKYSTVPKRIQKIHEPRHTHPSASYSRNEALQIRDFLQFRVNEI